MELGCLILCCLLSQKSPSGSAVPPFREEPAAAGPLVPVERPKAKLTPPVLVTESLTAPAVAG